METGLAPHTRRDVAGEDQGWRQAGRNMRWWEEDGTLFRSSSGGMGGRHGRGGPTFGMRELERAMAQEIPVRHLGPQTHRESTRLGGSATVLASLASLASLALASSDAVRAHRLCYILVGASLLLLVAVFDRRPLHASGWQCLRRRSHSGASRNRSRSLPL